MRYDERKEGGRKEAVSSAEVQEDYHQSPLGARCLGPGRGGGRQRPGQGEGSRKQCPELESSVCCSVQPCRSNAWCSDRGGRLSKLQGGWCPVGRPVAGAPAARAALPAAPGLARWGRGQSSQTPPPSLVPLLPSAFPVLSLLPSLQGRVYVASQPPLPNHCSWRRPMQPIPSLKPRAGCIMCLWLSDSGEGREEGGNGEGVGGAMLGTPQLLRSDAGCLWRHVGPPSCSCFNSWLTKQQIKNPFRMSREGRATGLSFPVIPWNPCKSKAP